MAAGFIGSLTRLVSPRKQIALENLNIVFPDKDTSWKEELLKKVYDHLSLSLTEYLCLSKKPERVLDWIHEVEGLDILSDLHAKGKGAVILTGHVGNWELLGAWLSLKGFPVNAVIRDPNDPGVAGILREYRKKTGLRTISKGKVMTSAVRSAKKGDFVALLADQDGGNTGYRIPFMGRECSTVGGPAMVSILADVELVPLYSYRVSPYVHNVVVHPPFSPPSSGDRNERILETSRRCNFEIEKMIHSHPEQWLWLHRRWR